ncbi:MAG TPA: glycosyltransferase family 39 protein, partial [Terriglobales bacterium]
MIVLISAAYLYARLFRGGTIPVLFQGDQVFFWSYGQRVLHGQLPYRDFFQITGPLTAWLFAADFWLFGERVTAANLFTLLLGVLLTTAVFLLARHFAANAIAALIAALYVVKIFGTFLSATHHFVSMAAIAVALLILARESSGWRCFAAGCACGFATLGTQTHGLAASAALLVALLLERDIAFPDRVRRCALLASGLLLVVLPPELLLGGAVGFARLWYYQVGLPSRWPGSGASSAWWIGNDPTAWAAVSLFMIYAFAPCVYALSAWRLFRMPAPPGDRFAKLMLAVGVALTLEVWLAPNEMRIFAVA